ncbi:hypothetical protein EBI_25805 [Enterocytozoon bieneusi H348]|nr:hypothetical protein EBI_25805 [Enterocytozoon bieneusi H348]|eukprot:XP_002652571.1 hypothetical protein EBI_25805 [Enterocytozoon bieneusi H348]
MKFYIKLIAKYISKITFPNSEILLFIKLLKAKELAGFLSMTTVTAVRVTMTHAGFFANSVIIKGEE